MDYTYFMYIYDKHGIIFSSFSLMLPCMLCNTICLWVVILDPHIPDGTIQYHTIFHGGLLTTVKKREGDLTSSLSQATISPNETVLQKQYTGSFGSMGRSFMKTPLFLIVRFDHDNIKCPIIYLCVSGMPPFIK
jgi:hypothetical protein